MAIDKRSFTEKVDTNLKSDSTYKRFYINFKKDGQRTERVLNYSDKEWDKRTRINKAKAELLVLKNRQQESGINFTENSLLNDITNNYFTTECDPTPWRDERQSMYNLYCSSGIGKKRIKSIRPVDFTKLRREMEASGKSVQSADGCSPRTVRKLLLQILKPIMQFAKENRVIEEIPTIKAPKQNRQKKIVEDPSTKLATLFQTIMKLYKDDPFYRALFLFALYGRRWNEIRTLKWSDIDFLDNRYTIRAENNKIGRDQTYELPTPILEALNSIELDHVGLVFKSPITGQELYTPKKQLQKIKEAAEIPELTMHYFRHILVSAMGEMGTATTILSASLGHTNLDTVNNFYLSANHTKASSEANDIIKTITTNAGNN